MIDLSGKTVLITGASRGIGAMTARTLGRVGAEVILHYHEGRDEVGSVADIIGRDRTFILQANLAEPLAPAQLWEKALGWKGKIDVVVNNAAVMPVAALHDSLDDWHEAWQLTLQVNLVAVADLCRHAISHFKSRDGGIIINVASRAGFRGDGPTYMPYAASKGGILALTRTIARGFAQDGILAFAVAPGFVQTDRTEALMQEKGADYVTRDIPMGTPAPTQDIANVIAFLASGLAPHATGTTIDVNGASYVR
jgi:NAD(P)-dependent dehydrogenase (short-subunit alcohol dehydrogenase family)